MEHLTDSKQYHLALVCPTEQKGGKKPFALLSALPWMTWRYQQLSMHVRKVGSGGANMKMFFFELRRTSKLLTLEKSFKKHFKKGT